METNIPQEYQSQNHITWFCGLKIRNQHQQKKENDTMVFYDLCATFVIEKCTQGNGSFSNEVATKTQEGLTDEHRCQVWKKDTRIFCIGI
jgi:hypothetical protein